MPILFFVAMNLASTLGPPAASCPEIKLQTIPWNGTALHEAIRRNDVKGALRSMDAATVNARDSFGNPPLVAALTPTASLEPAGSLSARRTRARIDIESRARQAIVSALLTKGAAVNDSGAQGATALGQLAMWGYSADVDRRLAEKLLRLGANVNARDDFGSTPLMLAARRGKTQLAKLLLSKGADPAITNCHGESAATLARLGGHLALARQLASAASRPGPSP